LKKTCDRCRAYGRGCCSLGYKVKMVNEKFLKPFNAFIEVMVPLERCPKPRTYDEYYLQRKLKIKED
jgi:hypothetical protein